MSVGPGCLDPEDLESAGQRAVLAAREAGLPPGGGRPRAAAPCAAAPEVPHRPSAESLLSPRSALPTGGSKGRNTGGRGRWSHLGVRLLRLPVWRVLVTLSVGLRLHSIPDVEDTKEPRAEFGARA